MKLTGVYLISLFESYTFEY